MPLTPATNNVASSQPSRIWIQRNHMTNRGAVVLVDIHAIGRGSTPQAPHVGSETNATVAWSRSGRLPRNLYYGTVPPYELSPDDLNAITDKTKRHAFARKAIIEQMHALASSGYVQDIL